MLLREWEERLVDGAMDAFGEAISSEVYAWGWEVDVMCESVVVSVVGGGFVMKMVCWWCVDMLCVFEGMDILDVVEIVIGARYGLARTRVGVVYFWGEGVGGKFGFLFV